MASTTVTSAPPLGVPTPLLDRDLSILAFNERVLDLARREDMPLLERLRFLTIVSSNLDEYFEVRGFDVLEARQTLVSNPAAVSRFVHVAAAAHALVADQYALYNDAIMPSLKAAGIRVIPQGERDEAQRKWVKSFFDREVRPLLVPVSLDPTHPFPLVANKSLNFIARLEGADAFGRQQVMAIVKVPRVLARLIPLPSRLVPHGQFAAVSLSSVIRAHLDELFPGRKMAQFAQFRVTRHSDLAVDEDDAEDLLTALSRGLQQRHFGQAVRLEVSSGCTQEMADFLLGEFKLPHEALYRVHGPVNLVRLGPLADLVPNPDLRFPPLVGNVPEAWRERVSVFDRLRRGDVLVHHPFQTFDVVMDFLREAVRDPDVLAIKQTIYRTGADSGLMTLLQEAVRAGKEVTVVVELKARFDEEANINWAERLETIGAQVVYGVVGLKTHAKMLLVTRREGRYLRRYGHLSTGNYNPRTARLYTDLSMLTADADLTADMHQLFVHIAGQSRLPRLKQLWTAPEQLHQRLMDKIALVGAAAATGKRAQIRLKMNALTDERLCRALMAAAQLGAHVELIVRGACLLPTGPQTQAQRIRVRSVVGRFLEHSRVFCFEAGDDQWVYLSSADWMSRNMTGRVELCWPVHDPVLKARIVHECLDLYRDDQTDAWDRVAGDTYRRVAAVAAEPHSSSNAAQSRLLQLWAL
jgi:polyphosphate kinase